MDRKINHCGNNSTLSNLQNYDNDEAIKQNTKVVLLCCITVPRNWKIKNQLVFTFGTMVSIIVALFTIYFTLNRLIVQNLIAQSLQGIMVQQFKMQRVIIPSSFQQLAQSQLHQSKISLNRFKQLYVQSMKKNDSTQTQGNVPRYQRLNNQCSYIYSKTVTQRYLNFIQDAQFQTSMTYTNTISFTQNIFSYLNFEGNSVFTFYPCNENITEEVFQQFDPSTRPWYSDYQTFEIANKNNKQALESMQYTNTYSNVMDGGAVQTLYGCLNDNKLQQLGLVLENIAYKNMKLGSFEGEFLIKNLFLINQDGLILLGPSQLTQGNSLYIFNTSITGYSRDSWNQILNYSKGYDYYTSCSASQIEFGDLCCMNNITKHNDIFLVQNFSSNFFIVCIFTEENLLSYLTNQMHVFNTDQIDLNYTNSLTLGLSAISLTFLVFIILHIMFRPLGQLHDYSMQLLLVDRNKKQKQILEKKIDLSEIKANGTIKIMIQSYLRMTSLFSAQQNSKNDICKEIEALTFPTKRNLPQATWLNEIQQLKDFNEECDEQSLKIQVKERKIFQIVDFFQIFKNFQSSSKNQYIEIQHKKLSQEVLSVQKSIFEKTQISKSSIIHIVDLATKIHK